MMYIDAVILMGLVVVVLAVLMMVYIARYAKKHMDLDEQKAASAIAQDAVKKRPSVA